MTEKFKCMVCGFMSDMPGEHCGQNMVKQTTPEQAPETAAPAAEHTEMPTATPTPTSENTQNPSQ